MNTGLHVAGKGSGSDLLLRAPKAPEWLNDQAKEGYKWMGNMLAKAQRLKPYYLPALEIFADAYAQWQWALREINRKNTLKPGTGYVQYFKNGASNISAEVTLKEKAINQMLHCCKLFGLDPKSEKELKATGDPAQTSLFAELMQKLG